MQGVLRTPIAIFVFYLSLPLLHLSSNKCGTHSVPYISVYWKTDMLPATMRHQSGHGGSHTFLAAEFINSLLEERTPAIDLYKSLAMTVPGIVAHQSALKNGEQLKVPCFDVTQKKTN